MRDHVHRRPEGQNKVEGLMNRGPLAPTSVMVRAQRRLRMKQATFFLPPSIDGCMTSMTLTASSKRSHMGVVMPSCTMYIPQHRRLVC